MTVRSHARDDAADRSRETRFGDLLAVDGRLSVIDFGTLAMGSVAWLV
jgi:hypothetical protein